MPARGTPEFYAFTLLHEILLDGHDSVLFQTLVQNKKLTGDLEGGVNLLGNQFDYAGPMLWIINALHDKDKPAALLVLTQPEQASLAATSAKAAARACVAAWSPGFCIVM